MRNASKAATAIIIIIIIIFIIIVVVAVIVVDIIIIQFPWFVVWCNPLLSVSPEAWGKWSFF